MILMTTAGVAHVIVDRVPGDSWSIAAAIAAIAATVVGIITLIISILTLRAAKAELELAEDQLRATETGSQQTREALELGREQVQQLRIAEARRLQALAPRVTAKLLAITDEIDKYVFSLHNSGPTALFVMLTGHMPDGSILKEFVQKLDQNETLMLPKVQSEGIATYFQFVRIRSSDGSGNRYITEYRSLGPTLAYPTFREPWIGTDVLARPERCSEEVSWEVEHFERIPGRFDESVEKGFDILAPA